MMGAAVHIGLHKTATTSLPQMLPERYPGLRTIGLPGNRHKPALREIRDYLFWASDADFNAKAEQFRQRSLDRASGRQIVSSDENISTGELRSPLIVAEPFGFSADYLFATCGPMVPCAVLARRLHRPYSDATVLIVLREQTTYVKSYYLQMQKIGALKLSLKAWLAAEWARPATKSFLWMLDYAAQVAIRAGAFGRNRVRVLCYGQLMRDQDSFSRALSEIQAAPTGEIEAAFNAEICNPLVSRLEIRLRPLADRIPGAWVLIKSGAIRFTVRGRLADAARAYGCDRRRLDQGCGGRAEPGVADADRAAASCLRLPSWAGRIMAAKRLSPDEVPSHGIDLPTDPMRHPDAGAEG
jgi:hypothetical protein